MQDVPVENFFALHETARGAGKYPINLNSRES
jgi:hypothetical protein